MNEMTMTDLLSQLDQASEAGQMVKITCEMMPNDTHMFIGTVRGFGDMHLGFNLVNEKRIGIPYASIKEVEVLA